LHAHYRDEEQGFSFGRDPQDQSLKSLVPGPNGPQLQQQPDIGAAGLSTDQQQQQLEASSGFAKAASTAPAVNQEAGTGAGGDLGHKSKRFQ